MRHGRRTTWAAVIAAAGCALSNNPGEEHADPQQNAKHADSYCGSSKLASSLGTGSTGKDQRDRQENRKDDPYSGQDDGDPIVSNGVRWNGNRSQFAHVHYLIAVLPGAYPSLSFGLCLDAQREKVAIGPANLHGVVGHNTNAIAQAIVTQWLTSAKPKAVAA